MADLLAGGDYDVLGAHSAGPCPGTVHPVQFSPDLREGVLAGEITLSDRLWTRPQVTIGGRYRVGPGQIEVDEIELVPFSSVTAADVRRCGEVDREALRVRTAHAGPVEDATFVYRVEFHAVS
jgi:hypothetical protein